MAMNNPAGQDKEKIIQSFHVDNRAITETLPYTKTALSAFLQKLDRLLSGKMIRVKAFDRRQFMMWDEPVAFCKHSQIYINYEKVWFDTVSRNNEKLFITLLKALDFHEYSHIMYTILDMEKDVIPYAEAHGIPQSLFKYAVNLLEDCRIENIFTRIYPRSKDYFTTLIAHMIKQGGWAWVMTYGRKYLPKKLRELHLKDDMETLLKNVKTLEELKDAQYIISLNKKATEIMKAIDDYILITTDKNLMLETALKFALLLPQDKQLPYMDEMIDITTGANLSKDRKEEIKKARNNIRKQVNKEQQDMEQQGKENEKKAREMEDKIKEKQAKLEQGGEEGNTEDEEEGEEGNTEDGEEGNTGEGEDSEGAEGDEGEGEDSEGAEGDEGEGEDSEGAGAEGDEGAGGDGGNGAGGDGDYGEKAGGETGGNGAGGDTDETDEENTENTENEFNEELESLKNSIEQGLIPEIENDLQTIKSMNDKISGKMGRETKSIGDKIAKMIKELKNDLKAQYIHGQRSGRINIRGAMHSEKTGNTRIFDKYRPSKVDKTKMAVCIHIDKSGSMGGILFRAFSIARSLSYGFMKAGGKVKIYAFDSRSYLVKDWDSKEMPKMSAYGSTFPNDALKSALKDFRYARKTWNIDTFLNIIITDGQFDTDYWSKDVLEYNNEVSANDIIAKMNELGVYTIEIAMIPPNIEYRNHGSKFFQRVPSIQELPDTIQRIVRAINIDLKKKYKNF